MINKLNIDKQISKCSRLQFLCHTSLTMTQSVNCMPTRVRTLLLEQATEEYIIEQLSLPIITQCEQFKLITMFCSTQ